MGQAQVIPAKRLYRSTLLAKAGMGITGLIMLGFVLGHMLGNLQALEAFGGREALNGYAKALQAFPGLLWTARLTLLGAIVLHIASAWKLTQLNEAARPSRYAVTAPKRSTFASRTMKWTGVIVLAYIVFHLAHFTFLWFEGYAELEPYENVVKGFSNPLITLLYIVANLALAVHMWHGVWALFQSLGLSHPKYDPLRRTLATGFTVIVTAGFLIVPIGVMVGLIA